MLAHRARVGLIQGLLAAAAISVAAEARAAIYFVDNSCEANGNGLVDTCAASAGGGGRFNDLHSCDTTMRAGDTCLIRPGTYFRNVAAEGRSDLNTGFHPVRSGTALLPITYKAFDPANPPLICSGPDCEDECSYRNGAIGVKSTDYVVFDGLNVKGSLVVWMGDHITVQNVQISHGWTYGNSCPGVGGPDGNWQALRTEYVTNGLFRNIYIHDVTRPAPDRGHGIVMYKTNNSVFEFMTVTNTLYAGMTIKDDCNNNEIRYNKFIRAGTGDAPRMYGSNQNGGGGNRIHHNLLVCGPSDRYSEVTAGYYIPTNMTSGVEEFSNNTVYGCSSGHIIGSVNNQLAAIRDNIIVLGYGQTHWNTVVGLYNSEPCPGCDYTSLDYNAYRYARWKWNTTADGTRTFFDLPSWKAFWDGRPGKAEFEDHSQIVDCDFASPGATLASDFHIRAAGCKTMSSTGGFVGAYRSDADCIGYGCSGGSVPINLEPEGTITAPAANVSIRMGESVSFSGTGIDADNNTPLAYRWRFGAGSGIAESTLREPGSKTFSTAGTFTVTFTVTDAKGASDSSPASRTITVTDPTQPNPLPNTDWTVVYVDSQETAGENGSGTNAIDGVSGSIWHTQWSPAAAALPHEIQVDLGAAYSLSGFRYLPRQDGNDNGRIGLYEFYVSLDSSAWGVPVAVGAMANDSSLKEIRFPQATARYVRLRALSSAAGDSYTSMAELTVLGTALTADTVGPPDVQNLRRTDRR